VCSVRSAFTCMSSRQLPFSLEDENYRAPPLFFSLPSPKRLPGLFRPFIRLEFRPIASLPPSFFLGMPDLLRNFPPLFPLSCRVLNAFRGYFPHHQIFFFSFPLVSYQRKQFFLPSSFFFPLPLLRILIN